MCYKEVPVYLLILCHGHWKFSVLRKSGYDAPDSYLLFETIQVGHILFYVNEPCTKFISYTVITVIYK